MSKRESLLALAALCVAPLIARSQQRARPARVALVLVNGPEFYAQWIAALKQGMHERGYAEGKDYAFEMRSALSKVDRLPQAAKEVIALEPDVIVAPGTVVVAAVLKATSAIPVVGINVTDPVGSGFAASLARPGRNVTGISFLQADVGAKRLELLLAVVPRLSRAAVLWNPSSLNPDAVLKSLQDAAQIGNVGLVKLDAQTPAGIDDAFSLMAREKIAAVIVPAGYLFNAQSRRIADLAIRHRIASVFVDRDKAQAGGLMSYGQDATAGWKYAATFIDKILKGAKPGDLPFEQSTTFELVVNLKTAKALGIKIPQSVLLRADRVIE